MKNINIKKNRDFSGNSKIYLHVGDSRTHINGFGLYHLSIHPREEMYATHHWTMSNRIHYDELNEGISLVIKPKLTKKLALIIGIVFVICSLIFLITKYRWSFLPLLPFVLYVGTYLTILKNRYLIIEKEKR